MFEHGQWYQGEIINVEYVKSEKKSTPAIELKVNVVGEGTITGQWWLTDSLVNDPRNKNNKVPQWEAARQRCILFGCSESELNGAEWIEHIRKMLIGQTAAVCAEVNSYGDIKAQFIGKPKGQKSAYVKQQAAPSPFAGRAVSAAADPFAVADDDVPF